MDIIGGEDKAITHPLKMERKQSKQKTVEKKPSLRKDKTPEKRMPKPLKQLDKKQQPKAKKDSKI